MRTRKLGASELEFTTIGLGTWAIGGPWQYGWSQQSDEDSEIAILEALDSEINWIDTAPIYGCGHSEEVVGRCLKKNGHKALIATKCGLLWDDERRKLNCLRRESIKKECENSLRRLKVEVIDLYQMHWAIPDEQIEEGWGAMSELVQEGKVRYLGVSNITIEQMKRLTGIHPITSIQPMYNMLHRDIENEMMSFCDSNNIGIVVYSPIMMGLLSGKFSVERMAGLPDDDVRQVKPEFQGEMLVRNLELVERLRDVANRFEISVAQLAIAWVLRNETVTAAIAGARRSGQIIETAMAGDIELGSEVWKEIEELLSEYAN